MTPYREAIYEARRKCVADAVVAHSGNVAAAARAIGVSRTHLFKLLAEFRIHVIRQTKYGNRGNGTWRELQ